MFNYILEAETAKWPSAFAKVFAKFAKDQLAAKKQGGKEATLSQSASRTVDFLRATEGRRLQ